MQSLRILIVNAFIYFPYFITLPKRKDQVEMSIKELSKLSHVMSSRRWLYEDVYKYLYSNRNPKTVDGISRVSPLGPKTVELYYVFCCKKMYYCFVVIKLLRTSRKIIGLPQKGLKSPKRFTNLPSGSMSSILNWMGLIHLYGSLGVPQTPKCYNAFMEVFIFIRMWKETRCIFAPTLEFQWNHYIE